MRDTMAGADEDGDEDDDDEDDEDDEEGEEDDIAAQAAAITPTDYEPYIFLDLNFLEGEEGEGDEGKLAVHQESKGDVSPRARRVEEKVEKVRCCQGSSHELARVSQLTFLPSKPAAKSGLSTPSAAEMESLANYIAKVNLLVMPRHEIEETVNAIFYKIKDIQMVMRREADNFSYVLKEKKRVG